MTPTTSGQERDQNGQGGPAAVAEELQMERERLRQWEERLKAREEALEEMVGNYPGFKAFVYAKLREEFEKTTPPLPENVDLEALIKEEGGLPLEAFIHELESPKEG